MEQFHHSRLYGSRPLAPLGNRGLVRAIMQTFEVLHRQHWAAPWDDPARIEQRR